MGQHATRGQLTDDRRESLLQIPGIEVMLQRRGKQKSSGVVSTAKLAFIVAAKSTAKAAKNGNARTTVGSATRAISITTSHATTKRKNKEILGLAVQPSTKRKTCRASPFATGKSPS